MREKRRVTQTYDMVFDSEKSYSDTIEITDSITNYLIAKEVMEILNEQIQGMIPSRYHHKVAIKMTPGNELFSNRVSIEWTYTP